MLAEHQTTYEPATAAEKDLVDQMIAASWRIRRMWTIETALLDCEIVRRQAQVKKEFTHIDGAVELAQAFRALADDFRSLALVSRYESRLYRVHHRAYAALRELQQQRKSPEEKNAKRTQEPETNITVEQALACSSESAALAATSAPNESKVRKCNPTYPPNDSCSSRTRSC